MAAEARFAERAEDVAQGLVAEEVDALVGEIELDVSRRGVRQTSTAFQAG